MDCFQPVGRVRRAYWKLVQAVRERSNLLSVGARPPFRAPEQLQALCKALSVIASFRRRWLQKPSDWQPAEELQEPENFRPLFLSLLEHMLVQYPVPRFLAYAWLADRVPRWHYDLLLHMAGGSGIRQFDSRPAIPVCREAAKFFMEAPEDLTPLQALRWAQVRGMGGNDPLANLLARQTILSGRTRDERFWESAIAFMVRERAVNVGNGEYCPAWWIVNFLHEQRFMPGEEVLGPGGGSRPLQPNFSLKGRTYRSLRRYHENWRQDLIRQRPEIVPQRHHWAPVTIDPLEYLKDGYVWTISELLDDRALVVEGISMSHCVGSYVEQCVRRITSIWSLRVRKKKEAKPMVTIEVDPRSKVIVQAKAKGNEPPGPASLEILRLWADREGLQLNLPA